MMRIFQNDDGQLAEILFYTYMILTLIPLMPIPDHDMTRDMLATCGEGFASGYCAPLF